MPACLITADDPGAPDVRRLLARHLAFAGSHSPPEDVHALDVAGLLDADVSFFSYREGGVLLAVGALKRLGDDHSEIKSMHVVEAARGRGLGEAMLEHLVRTARQDGARRVSLETGSMQAFAPARALYARAGFVVCEPFGSYSSSRHSTFMTLSLQG